MVDVADINWLGALVGAALAFALGALWYRPAVFGNRWMEATGRTEADIDRNDKAPFFVAAGAWLVTGWIVAYLLAYAGGSGLVNALRVALSVGVVAAAIGLMNAFFSGRRRLGWAIDHGYALTGLAIIGVVLGLWP